MSGLTDEDREARVLSDRRFAALTNLESEGGCWLWIGAKCRSGYGKVNRQRRTWKAHRWAYYLAHGSIASSLTVDHLCNTPACVRPTHLELVTDEENRNRGSRSPLKSECPRQHPYSDANTYRVDGRRYCRTCRREATRRWKARREAAL